MHAILGLLNTPCFHSLKLLSMVNLPILAMIAELSLLVPSISPGLSNFPVLLSMWIYSLWTPSVDSCLSPPGASVSLASSCYPVHTSTIPSPSLLRLAGASFHGKLELFSCSNVRCRCVIVVFFLQSGGARL